MGIEISEEDPELPKGEEKDQVKAEYKGCKSENKELIQTFRENGYSQCVS